MLETLPQVPKSNEKKKLPKLKVEVKGKPHQPIYERDLYYESEMANILDA